MALPMDAGNIIHGIPCAGLPPEYGQLKSHGFTETQKHGFSDASPGTKRRKIASTLRPSNYGRNFRELENAKLTHDGFLCKQFSVFTERRVSVLPKVTSVVNQKGGACKTTTALNLAAALAETGARVLLIDSDPESRSASDWSAVRGEKNPPPFKITSMPQPILHRDVPGWPRSRSSWHE